MDSQQAKRSSSDDLRGRGLGPHPHLSALPGELVAALTPQAISGRPAAMAGAVERPAAVTAPLAGRALAP